MPTSEDFPNLLARVRHGDEAAVAELVRRYEPEVRRVAHARLGKALRPYLDSMDLVQSVHRSLLVGLRQNRFDFATPENLIALAVTMVRRKVARLWRRCQAGPPRATDVESLLLHVVGSSDDPAQAAQYHDQVRRVLDGLPELDRRLIELRLQGCSTAEAGRELGIDPAVLRVRLQRLRQRFRENAVMAALL
jgi:RNA polymerase sigma-70 factor (ECF subfamily)